MIRSMLRHGQFLSSLAVLTLAVAAPTLASDTDVVEIEEHWQLSVGGPDTARSAPQVTMIMSPVDHLADDFFAFTLNHWTYPDFEAGGYQLQKWHGSDCVAAKHGYNTGQLHHDGESISWVQRLSVQEGTLKFQVLSGDSTTWGQFGGTGFSLHTGTSLTRLNGYRPAISINQSGIGYAGNRVSSLTLQKIRWKTADGQEHEMTAPIDIDSDLDP